MDRGSGRFTRLLAAGALLATPARALFLNRTGTPAPVVGSWEKPKELKFEVNILDMINPYIKPVGLEYKTPAYNWDHNLISYSWDDSLVQADAQERKKIRDWQLETHCMLMTCNTKGVNAPRVYTFEREDGVGGRVVATILVMEIAYRANMNFGGVTISAEVDHVSHAENFNRIMMGVFGKEAGNFTVLLKETPKYDHEFKWHRIADLRQYAADHKIARREKVFLSPFSIHYIEDEPLDEDFLLKLRSDPSIASSDFMTGKPYLFRIGAPTVAIHLRRGDVHEGEWRWTNDDWYYDQILRIRKVLPNAEFHVFTSSEYIWAQRDFDGYRRRNCWIHMDHEFLSTWSHLRWADVVILSESAFSYVPAYFSRPEQCVIWFEYFLKRRVNWVNGTSPLRDYAAAGGPDYPEKLRACLERSKEHQKIREAEAVQDMPVALHRKR